MYFRVAFEAPPRELGKFTQHQVFRFVQVDLESGESSEITKKSIDKYLLYLSTFLFVMQPHFLLYKISKFFWIVLKTAIIFHFIRHLVK